MTKPLYSPPRPAPVFARKRRISPRQAEMLESLWNAQLRRAGRRPRPERSREERFHHIAETVGRTVQNAGELSWREANRVLRRLLDEIRSDRASRPAGGESATSSGNNRPAASRRCAATDSRKQSATLQAPASETIVRRAEVKAANRRKPQP
jgi:hypothetical protein